MGFVPDIYVEYLAPVVVRLVKRWNARSWKLMKGRITGSAYRGSGFGCTVADIAYNYEVNSRTFSARTSVPFIFDKSAHDYVQHYPSGTDLLVRVRPDDPNVSVVRGNDLYCLKSGFQLETE